MGAIYAKITRFIWPIGDSVYSVVTAFLILGIVTRTWRQIKEVRSKLIAGREVLAHIKSEYNRNRLAVATFPYCLEHNWETEYVATFQAQMRRCTVCGKCQEKYRKEPSVWHDIDQSTWDANLSEDERFRRE